MVGSSPTEESLGAVTDDSIAAKASEITPSVNPNRKEMFLVDETFFRKSVHAFGNDRRPNHSIH